MKVCVLQPDYSTTGVDYKNYDPPRDLSLFIPEAEVHNVFLNKLTTYKQIKELGKKGYDVFVNLCEGYLEWEVPMPLPSWIYLAPLNQTLFYF